MENNNDFDAWLNSSNFNNENKNKENEAKNNVFETETDTKDFTNEKLNVEQNTEYKKDNKEEYVSKKYVEELIKKTKPKFRILKTTAFVLFGAILGSFVGPYANGLMNGNYANNDISINKSRAISIVAKDEDNVENAVAKKAIPSVVGIRVTMEGRDSIFGQTMESTAIGSGVIVSKDGYILTNAHVVSSNSKAISVLFSDKSTEDAKVIWMDETLDLAVVKVKRNNLQAIEFADSDKIEIGDKAIAIGNPLGLNLQSTLTSGYISGLNRSITIENGLIMNGLIQTDASINSGNSGGALLNKKGQLIGINTAKAGRSDGIGFSIPSNIAHSVVESIRENGDFNPVLLGIRGMDLANYKERFVDNSIKTDKGIFVSEVVEGTSAYYAGIKPKDIILKINSEEVESMNRLKQILLKYKEGQTVKISVFRNGKTIDLNLKFLPKKPNA